MPAAGARILLVEDDPGMAVLAADSLIDVEDSTLTVAESAAECRAHIARQAFDVVLLDRGLPDCDGAALIGEIIAQQPDAAIVMLSGADSADSATETLLLGAWDYIVKRPDLQHLRELPAVIRRCVERKRWRENEARLRTEMEMLLTALRGTGDAVIMADTERRVHFWNAAAERLFGWRAEDVLGQPLPMVPADRELESMDLMARARSGDPLVVFETVRQRRDGSLVEVSLTLTTALNLDGSVYAYVSVIRDISERKALERARADFAAMLTHDLKNPLAVIQGCAKLLEEAGLTPEDTEWVASIDRAAGMIDRLVADLLLAATIEAGKLTLAIRPIAVGALLASAMRQFRAVAARKDITLRTAGEAETLHVSGDLVQLERALGNLIDNAIKYTPAGGVVTVQALCRNGDLWLRVEDTGPGISTEDLPHVFEKYRRARATGNVDGAGLGLYIVRYLAEAHGGTVSVDSRIGSGSVFTITLPLVAPD